MSGYALIKSGVVINTIVWDGETELDLDDDVEFQEIADNMQVGKGFSYENGIFEPPPLTDEEIEKQKSDAIAENVSIKDSLMSEASQRISVLQDAVDLEMATDDEAKLLPLWKKYRVLLSRISANTSGEGSWPTKPE